MKLTVLTWVHDRKAERWRWWPVVGRVWAYAVGYVEGERYGEEELPGLFGSRNRRTGRCELGKTPASGAYSAGRRAGAQVRRERSNLRLVA